MSYLSEIAMQEHPDRDLDQFMRLIEQALKRLDPFDSAATPAWMRSASTKTRNSLEALRKTAQEGRLPRISRGDVPTGTGLGIGRAVGEWCEDDGVLAAVRALELHYRERL